MQKSRIFAISLLALGTVAFANVQGITLRRKLTPGTDVYLVTAKTSQAMTIPGMGDQDMDIAAGQTHKFVYGEVKDGKQIVKLTMTTDKMDMTGPMAQAMGDQKIPAIETTSTLDELNRMVAIPDKKKNNNAMMQMMMSSGQSVGLAFEFPSKAIAIGESWDIVIPKSTMTPKEQKLKATLVGEAEGGYQIKITGTIAIAGTPPGGPAESPMGPMTTKLKGSTAVDSDAIVDKESGKTLRLKVVAKSKMNVDINDGQMSIDSSGTSTTEYILKK